MKLAPRTKQHKAVEVDWVQNINYQTEAIYQPDQNPLSRQC
jgi:hypothetical protein